VNVSCSCGNTKPSSTDRGIVDCRILLSWYVSELCGNGLPLPWKLYFCHVFSLRSTSFLGVEPSNHSAIIVSTELLMGAIWWFGRLLHWVWTETLQELWDYPAVFAVFYSDNERDCQSFVSSIVVNDWILSCTCPTRRDACETVNMIPITSRSDAGSLWSFFRCERIYGFLSPWRLET
jgi:hypothetical protein